MVARLDRRLAAGLDLKRVAAEQLPIGHGLPVRTLHRAIGDGELARIRPELLGCEAKQDLAGLRRHLTHRAAAIGHGEGACGHAFIRANEGIAGDDVEPLDVDIEFIRAELGEGGEDALPEFHFADLQAHLSSRLDAQP